MKNRLKLLPNMVVAASIISLPGVSSAAELEEIIVTATKRAESVQDVGLSVQVFDESLLREGGINNVSRLELLVSGVNYAFVGNDAKFNVRGANSSNTFGDAASIVGTFVDGVYKPRASQQTRAFFDVERVEFLKGPQGTLYGRNTLAGALNLHTKAPSFDDGLSGNFQLGFERYNAVKADGAINLPVTDTIAIRAAAVFNNSDGYINNLAGADIGAQDDLGVRISALFEPSDTMDWTLRYQRSEEDGREAGLFGYTFICRGETASGLTDPFGPVQNCNNPVRGSAPLFIPEFDGDGNITNLPAEGFVGEPNAADFDPAYTISQDYVPEIDLVEDTITLEGNIRLSDLAVKMIANYTDFENRIGFDFDFSPQPNQIGGYDETIKSLSLEWNLSSDFDGPVNFTSGWYYSMDEHFASFSIYQQSPRLDTVRGNVPVLGLDGTPVFVLDAEGNLERDMDGNPVPLRLPVLSGTPITTRNIELGGFFADSLFIESDTFGFFGEVEGEISDVLRLTGGLRYSTEDKSLDGAGSNFTGDTDGDGTNEPVVTVRPEFLPDEDGNPASPTELPESRDVFNINRNADDAIKVSETYDNVTFRIGAEYDLNETSLVYGTISTGFLSGAVTTGGATDEQESMAYEIGYKSYLLDNTLKFNIAGHFTQYENLLTQEQIPVGGIVQTRATNGGEIDAYGIEIESVYVPNDNLTLGFNFAWLDSEYGTFGVNNPYQLWNGEVRPFIDLDGEVTPWSPEYTLSLFGSYRFDLGEYGSVTPYIQVYVSDEYNTSNIVGTDPNQIQDSFTKTDIRITWEDLSQRYRIEAFVENLEDEAVLARGNNNSDHLVQTGFLYPRNFGVRLSAAF